MTSLLLALALAAAPTVKVGSKKFTESVILGDALVELARVEGAQAVHRRELGGTRVLWDALVGGEIDAYPEYTGTISQELLGGVPPTFDALRPALAAKGIGVIGPLGFEDTYAIGMKAQRATALGVSTLSQLARTGGVRFGFSNEFIDRADGWPALKARYGFAGAKVIGLDHDLAYRALEGGAIDATDLYSTDAEIPYYHLRVLADDRHAFPPYQAVVLYRRELEQRTPKVLERWRTLEGAIDVTAMQGMNAEAKLDRVPEPEVAARFLREHLGLAVATSHEGWGTRLWRRTREHLWLVGWSLLFALLLALPLGIASARYRRAGQLILGVTGVLQTIPSLALLVFMIPLLGIGAVPAIVALFLYSLLPIVRNTHAGLTGIPSDLRESAEALGLTATARLWRIELPLATPQILAGIKIAAVIDIGTATLGALIGAGGYGQPILTGIRLDDVGLILEGAVPAALLALAAQGLFELAERWLVPKGLRG